MFEGLDNAYPLTPLQQGMLYEGLKNPSSNIYVAYIAIDITGDLDVDLLKQAWQCAVQRHETLRTRFVWEGLDEPLQLVNSAVELDWTVCDSREALLASSALEYWLDQEQLQHLNLTDSPPTRFRLIRFSDTQSTLVWTVHHLLADDWSIPQVLQTVADEYHRILTSPEAVDDAAGPQFSFVSYVDWLASEDQEHHRQWWERQLGGVEPTSIKPGYNSVDLELDSKIQHQKHVTRLGKELSGSLLEKSRVLGVTPSSVFHAAWALVIACFSGRDRALFGTSVSGRTCPLSGMDKAVGLFLNTLPTHIQIDAGTGLDDFIKGVQQQLFEQLAHEHVPLMELQRLLPVDESRLAFESLLVVETRDPGFRVDVQGSTLSFGNIRSSNDSNIPLTVLVFPGTSAEIQLHGPESYFGQGAFARLCDEFVAVLTDICRPEAGDLAQVLEYQSQRLGLFYPAASPISLPGHEHITDWIRSAALVRPGAVAIIDDGEKYTYTQLLSAAEKIARAIAQHGSSSPFVAVSLERGFNQIAAVLGVLLSGKAYVPIDPGWPQARSREILETANVELLISVSTAVAAGSVLNATIVFVDQLADKVEDGFVPQHERHRDDPAYMIFTSGSTGRPKGVVISHRNLVYSTAARIEYYEGGPRSFLLLSSFAFDSSVAGIFWTLCTGGSLVLPGSGKSRDIHELANLVSGHQVSHTLCLPSIYSLLLRYAEPGGLKSLGKVIVAGEVCPSPLPALSHEKLPGVRLYNEYGPTEATVWSTVAELQPEAADTAIQVSIGRAIPGTQVQVINERGEICPPGVGGELVVTGPGVARGYFEDAQLTSARFSPRRNEPLEADGLRSYKTGDLATLGHDGLLYFLGRTDHQLKIRGHRIEAGEITSRIERHADVLEAACILQDFAGSEAGLATDKRLVCYYTLNAQPGLELDGCRLIDDPGLDGLVEDVRESTSTLIKQELPAQFTVFRFVAVNRFPRLPNGKIDLTGFPSISGLEAGSHEVAAASEVTAEPGGVEAQLCDLLGGLLGASAVPPEDNFFAVGGDSLTAIRFVAAAREQGLALTVPMITEYATMRELANAPELHADSSRERQAVTPHGESPLSAIQQWFFSSGHPRPSHWNMAFMVELKHAVSAEQAKRAIFTMMDEFPVLGARFEQGREGYMQFIRETVDDDFLVQSIRPPSDRAEWVEALRAVQADFDLGSGTVTRFLLAADEEQKCLAFGAVIHHLVTDALSNWYIAKRIVQLLEEGEGAQLGGVSTVSYREWSLLQEQAFQAGETHRDALPAATAGSWTENGASSQTLELSRAELAKARHYCEQHSVDLHEYVLFLLLRSGNFESEIRVDVETHGRDLLESTVDASAAVGWFTSFFPFNFSPDADTDLHRFRDELRRVRRESASEFVRDPMNYFDSAASPLQAGPGSQPGPILYNYLAMNAAASTQVESEGVHFTPLTDTCFRDDQSLREHATELLVTDHDGGLALTWRVDAAVAGPIGLSGWIKRCRSMLQDQPETRNQSVATIPDPEFPDSGLDENELSDFLDSLD